MWNIVTVETWGHFDAYVKVQVFMLNGTGATGFLLCQKQWDLTIFVSSDTQDIWGPEARIIKKVPAVKSTLSTHFVHWKVAQEGTSSCFLYRRRIQGGTLSPFLCPHYPRGQLQEAAILTEKAQINSVYATEQQTTTSWLNACDTWWERTTI